MTTKLEVKQMLQQMTSKTAKDTLEAVRPYFLSGTKYTTVGDMLEEINEDVWDNLDEDIQTKFRDLSIQSGSGDLKTQIREAVESYFEGKYVCYSKEGRLLWFGCNTKDNTLKRLHKDGEKLVPVLVSEFVKNQAEELSVGQGAHVITQSDKGVQNAVEYYLNRVESLAGDPAVWSTDTEIPAFGRPMIEPIEDNYNKFENISKFFARLSDGEALAAWIWGVYSNEYVGRQVPWVTGNAQQKKSLIFNTLFTELFGNAYVSCAASDEKNSDKFFTSYFEYAKLAVIPDNNNKMMIMSGWLKMMTGKDSVKVERKFADATSKPLEASVFILANCEPEFHSKQEAISRAMPQRLIDEKDPEFVENLADKVVEEVPYFLSWAKFCYKMRCKDGYKVTINDAVLHNIELATRRHEKDLFTFFHEHYEISEGNAVTLKRITNDITDARLNNRWFRENFLTYLEYKYGILGEHVGTIMTYRGIIAIADEPKDWKGW